MGFFEKLKEGLKKTKEAVFKQVTSLFSRYTVIDDDLYEELEEILITSDVGVGTTEQILESLQETVRSEKITEPEEARQALMKILAEMIGEGEPLNLSTTPAVVLVIGVNGVGKTTSIAKISNLLKKEGKKVVLAAADTFRAAAIDQIAVWADRVGVDLVRHDEGSDPASVVYDAISAAKSRGADVLIVDTAGRLHNKKNLMDELAKMFRIVKRELPESSIETLLVLDAATGQNAVNQAREFKNIADITGIILTKIDGTAKGGVVLAIENELKIPVKYIGVGEQIDDLRPFDAAEFTEALFE